MEEVIDDEQSGFVLGICISENIVIAREWIYFLNYGRCKDNMMLKLDMEKPLIEYSGIMYGSCRGSWD